MIVLVLRDTPRNSFALIVDGERVGEFASEADAWAFAELSFGVAQQPKYEGGRGPEEQKSFCQLAE